MTTYGGLFSCSNKTVPSAGWKGTTATFFLATPICFGLSVILESLFFFFIYFCHNLLKTQRMGGFTGTVAVCPTVGKFWFWFPVGWCSRSINSLASECLDGIPPSPPACSHTSTLFIRDDKWCSGQGWREQSFVLLKRCVLLFWHISHAAWSSSCGE